MNNRFSCRLSLLALGVMGALTVFSDDATAGEQRAGDNMGITVDSARRNADRIRRSENRAMRDINRVNENVYY